MTSSSASPQTSDKLAPAALDTFIARWQRAGGSERANYQLFLTELCELLGLPRPDPAGDDTRDNAYVFERRVVMRQPDGSANNGFIDLYRRGAFVLEAKQTGRALDSSGWDKAMLRAHNQADHYARALPADEGRPPFILVTDVGRNIELYAEFSRSGATYTPYPDPRSHRIRLEDLRRDDIRQRLRDVWLDPLALDPARRSARVTREIADRLASLARSLEAAGHAPQQVAGFLMRANATSSAPTTPRAPTSSAWCCPPSSNRCAPNGARCRPPRSPTSSRASTRKPSPRSALSTATCARCACSTPPAAAAIFCM